MTPTTADLLKAVCRGMSKPQGGVSGARITPPSLSQKQDRSYPDEGYLCAAVFDMCLPGSSHSRGLESLGCRQDDTEVIMEHGWKHWLGVFAAATVLTGGLASIFHRDNATAPRRQSAGCSGACPCGTI